MSEKNKVTVRGLFRRQSVFANSRQWFLLPGATWSYRLHKGQQGQDQHFSLGLSCRISGHTKGQPVTFDAFIPAAYFEWDDYVLGFSYDVNVSAAKKKSYLRGGWEVSITCPISRKSKCVVCPDL